MANSPNPQKGAAPIALSALPNGAGIAEFSVSFFYKLDAQGRAPATMRLGRRRTISYEADQAWARANESTSAA